VHAARKMPKNAHAHFILGLMYQRLGQPMKVSSRLHSWHVHFNAQLSSYWEIGWHGSSTCVSIMTAGSSRISEIN
jgi:hypothetical protein